MLNETRTGTGSFLKMGTDTSMDTVFSEIDSVIDTGADLDTFIDSKADPTKFVDRTE